MRYIMTAGIILPVLIFFFAYSAKGQAKVDPNTGLIIAPGFEMVKITCTACHSAKFITFQRGDRDTWLSMIRWMQRTQGLWKFEAKQEESILNYLATNYPPGKASRRPNLSVKFLPQMQ